MTISIILFILIPVICHAQEFNFTQEYDIIPVSFDGVECQVPWTMGYCYINPTFCDIDGDDDFDLFFGSDWARLTYMINDGDQIESDFSFQTDYLIPTPPGFEPQTQTPEAPVFCDIDNDGDYDLFVGLFMCSIPHGMTIFYKNVGNNQSPVFELEELYFQGIDHTGDHYPTFVDIDNDNDFDLFIGFGYAYNPTSGKIAFYRNEGTPDSASMILQTEQFMGLDLGDYCIPSFIDIDDDGDQDMFLGDGEGIIHFYRNDGTTEVYDFTEVPGAYAGIDYGEVVSPAFCDIDDDGDFDLFVGERSWGQDNRRGDINYYENIGTASTAEFQLVTQNLVTMDIGKSAVLEFVDIDNDGLIDLFIGEGDGNINYLSNTGTETEAYFTFETESFEDISATYKSSPNFGDLDNDGDLDLLVGRSASGPGSVRLYENTGSPEFPRYDLVTNDFLEIECFRPSPRLIDIDNDGDLDLFVGRTNLSGFNDCDAAFYRNIGTPLSFNFILEDWNYFEPDSANDSFFLGFGDIDNDGDYDMLRGHSRNVYVSENVYIDLYRNIGSPVNPVFILEEEHFLGIELLNDSQPCLVDMDADGDYDLVISDFNGGSTFWRNNGSNSVWENETLSPIDIRLGQNYPNPFNASTVVPFTLDRTMPVKVTVYNQLGQEVWSLVTGHLSLGYHEVVWDASGVGSGVYLVRLDAGEFRQARKVMLVK